MPLDAFPIPQKDLIQRTSLAAAQSRTIDVLGLQLRVWTGITAPIRTFLPAPTPPVDLHSTPPIRNSAAASIQQSTSNIKRFHLASKLQVQRGLSLIDTVFYISLHATVKIGNDHFLI